MQVEDFMDPSGSATRKRHDTGNTGRLPIGQVLLRKGLITQEQLNKALEIQASQGGQLGWIAFCNGWVSRLDFFRALAEHYGFTFWLWNEKDFENMMDASLVERFSLENALRYRVIPFFRVTGGVLTVLTDSPRKPLDEELKQLFRNLYGVYGIEQWVVTDLDFIKAVRFLWGNVLIDTAIHGLFYRKPEESAFRVFSKSQVLLLGLSVYGALLWLYINPTTFICSVFGFIQALFSILVLFKTVLTLVGARFEMVEAIKSDEVESLSDEALPVYSILLPVYKEPEVVGKLVNSLKNLDYPPQKLDVILLLEEEDKETLEAAKEAKPPGNWRFIIVPDAMPKTKPKACNYGLFFARGELLTIYDAEDIPEPDQLKKAVLGFKKHGKSCVCLQAALNYFNASENFITRMFTLEYSYWFDYLLPGLDRLKLPIPLGGTSNHFRVDFLRQLGGWDPFNVTEDADLGVRASAHGMTVGVINSTTYEEANSRYWNWIRQRSRWIKGYMQTALVYNRHPIRMINVLGFKRWISFQLFVAGTPLLFLSTPVVWSVFFYWIATQTKLFDPFFPPLVVYWGLFNLLWGNFLGIYLNMVAVFKRELYSFMPYSLLNPVYWLFFHSVAAYKALWQLFFKPFYWEKTVHGISSVGASFKT